MLREENWIYVVDSTFSRSCGVCAACVGNRIAERCQNIPIGLYFCLRNTLVIECSMTDCW
jgi:hypothetical protein